MSNYVIHDRAIIEAVNTSSKKFGITLTFLSDGWVIRLQKDKKTHFIYVYNFDCNTHASASIASDKVATYQLLTDNRLSAVPHHLLSSTINPRVNKADLAELYQKYPSLVIKPTHGRRGSLVAALDDIEGALHFIEANSEISWTASPFIDVYTELRVIVFNDKVEMAYEKYNPPVINGLKMYNLSLGAQAKTIAITTINTQVSELAKQSMRAIGLTMGAVDIIISNDMVMSVLEVNSGFSLEHYARLSSQNREAVVSFYERVISSLFNKKSTL